MDEFSVLNNENWQPLLDLIRSYDSLTDKVLHRPTSPASDRPQDYVISILVTRSFRLAISGIRLALSGYPDSVPNLDRTIFEISIRLLDIGGNPISGSLGYLIQGSAEEISAMEAELNHRTKTGEVTGNLGVNLESMRKHMSLYESLARRHNLNPRKIQKQHGILNVRNVCKKYGIEKAYFVDYCYYSSHVHEKNVATSEFLKDREGIRQFEFGPIADGCVECVVDVLRNLGMVISIASDILQDKDINRSIRAMRAKLDEAYLLSKAK